MKRGEQKLNIAGVKFGIILIMTAMCLAGCTKKETFIDSCDLEIAEQVTSIMQESQKGRYNLENCEVFFTKESKKDGYMVRRMAFQADWKWIREPESERIETKFVAQISLENILNTFPLQAIQFFVYL